MLAEHSFVSRLEADDVRRRCTGQLEALGFACDVPADALLHAQRGGVAVGRARMPAEWPLRVRVQYDRGRVAVAASIDETRTKPGPAGERLLLELLRLLEAAACDAPETGEASRSWNGLLAAVQVEHAAARSRRGGAVIGCVIVAAIALLLVVILAVAGKG